MTPKQKNLVPVILIAAAVLLYVFSGGSVGISLDFGEDALAISAADYDWRIAYDRIQSLKLQALPDKGLVAEGLETRKLCCGTWNNEAWGEYTLCIDPRIDCCIVITTHGGDVYVLNYENEEATRQLHKMFTELLGSKGYL